MADTVLLAEDDREVRELLTETLEAAGYEVAAYPSAGRAVAGLGSSSLVITDLVMPGMSGRDFLDEVRARRPELNVIVITAFGTIDSAIDLVKAGAYDYLTKPFGSDELLLAVERALEESRLRREAADRSRVHRPLDGFVGASRPMYELYGLIRKVASSALPALITGETGTGKELVARALHALSNRNPFVAVNCSAIPDALMESELFGHERGAFTGADRDKAGLFESADGGTLFLDEVAELPLTLQPKLLRVLEQGEVRRLGSRKTCRVDVRIVSATNRDLEGAVGAGAFREDLFWRLNAISLRVPPLRDRPADVHLLVEHFLRNQTRDGHSPAAIAPAAMGLLTVYPWPGNVRELRHVIESATTLAAGPRIEVSDLPARIRDPRASSALLAGASEKTVSLRELERLYIHEVLRQTDGNRSRAAEILGLDRKTLYRKLQDYEA
jgi:DNA-binding NtrC family response regulator